MFDACSFTADMVVIYATKHRNIVGSLRMVCAGCIDVLAKQACHVVSYRYISFNADQTFLISRAAVVLVVPYGRAPADMAHRSTANFFLTVERLNIQCVYA